MKNILTILLLITLSVHAIPFEIPDPISITSSNQATYGFEIKIEDPEVNNQRIQISVPKIIQGREIDAFLLLSKNPNEYVLIPIEYKAETNKAIANLVLSKGLFDDFEIEVWYLNETGEFPDLEHKYKIDLEQFIKK